MLDTRGGTWVQLVKDNKEGNGGGIPHCLPSRGQSGIFLCYSRTMGQFRDCVYIVNENITLFQQLSENSDDLYGF